MSDRLKLAAEANERPAYDGCEEDRIIANALADDDMRIRLYVDWVTRGKQGQNPDDMDEKSLGLAYSAMVMRQHAQESRNR